MTGHVVIVGGGIAGLAAAWQLQRDGVSFELLESADRVGGKLGATEVGGRLVDEGADAFLARVPHATELVAELGLSDQLISPAASRAQIWTGRELMELPRPNVLGIPMEADAVRDLLGDAAADAVTADLARIGAMPIADDATIGSVVRARLGDDVHTQLVDPLIGAINAGDTDDLSLHASSPQILAAAQANPSLIRGLQSFAARRDPDAPVFHSFEGGVGVLIEALAHRLGSSLTTNVGVSAIERTPVGLVVHTTDGGQARNADAVVLTTPAPAAATIVRAWPDAADRLGAVPMVSVALVTLVFDAGAVAVNPTLSGFLVPRSADLSITACSWASSKWPHLAADDGAVVARVSVGHTRDQVSPNLGDDALIALVRSDLARAVGLDADPAEARISRWPGAFPQYLPGHLDRLAQIEGDLNPAGIFVAGMSHRGIGIPACIDQGRSAAVEAVLHLLS